MDQDRGRLARVVRVARWIIHTPWPILALDMIRANIIGALLVFAYLRFGAPDGAEFTIERVQPLSLGLFGTYLVLALVACTLASAQLSLPVLIWHRRRTRPDDERARRRALQLPALLAMVQGAAWIIGTVLFLAINWDTARSSYLALIAYVTFVGGSATCILSYLQAERVLRPITIAALEGDPDGSHAPSVTARIVFVWIVTTALPLGAIALLSTAQRTGLIGTDPGALITSSAIVAFGSLAFGAVGVHRLVRAINDPIKELRDAVRRVQDGNLKTRVRIYDGSDIGLLQAGFNSMVGDLRERQELRNLFGRYVGEDVARKAMESGTRLGGEERYIGVLFVDIVGSTRLAVNQPPSQVVDLLNDFFKVIVDVVGRHGGFVNKFLGDAAMAVFGAPIDHEDFAGAALSAARDLRMELMEVFDETDFGIGVSAGKAVAGHIGSDARFEFTVIGDPVNEASRLTDLAKDEPTRVLASARAVLLSDDVERHLWTIGEGVELRGRGMETRLARPTGVVPATPVPLIPD